MQHVVQHICVLGNLLYLGAALHLCGDLVRLSRRPCRAAYLRFAALQRGLRPALLFLRSCGAFGGCVLVYQKCCMEAPEGRGDSRAGRKPRYSDAPHIISPAGAGGVSHGHRWTIPLLPTAPSKKRQSCAIGRHSSAIYSMCKIIFYTKWAIRSSRSPGSRSMTGISIMV